MSDIPETEWPLWRVALKRLRQLPSFGYGLTLELAWFEHELACKRDTAEFAFGLMEIRRRVEEEDGYYVQTQTVRDDEAGTKQEVAQIPCAGDHEDVARSFESKMRSYSHRAVELRVKTLGNEVGRASMKPDEIARMEKAQEIAAVRCILIKRERSIGSYLKKHASKLLASKTD